MPDSADQRQSVNVVCLKWGQGYSSDFVNKLFRGVKRNLSLPHRFICFTDDPTGIVDGVEVRDLDVLVVAEHLRNDIFQKVALTHSLTGLRGRTLFLDLDVILLRPIDDLFAFEGQFCIIHNWIELRKRIARRRPDIGNSSVFRFEPGEIDDVFDRFLADPRHAREDFPTEQAFLSHAVGNRKRYWPADWVQSYKFNCRPTFPLNWLRPPKIPPETKILVFHGNPKPDVAIDGFAGKWHKRTLPMPQLSDHWV